MEYCIGVILLYVEFYGERVKDVSKEEMYGFQIGVESYILDISDRKSVKIITAEAMKAFGRLKLELPQDFYIGFLNGFGVAYNKFCN